MIRLRIHNGVLGVRRGRSILAPCPRPISLFGVAAVCVSLVGMAVELFGRFVPIFVSLPIGLFELVIGVWFLVRGIPG